MTMGAGATMGAAQLGFQAVGSKVAAGYKKDARRAIDRHKALMYELANKELDQSEKDLAQGDVDHALAINDDFNQRGDGEVDFVSGQPQAQDRRKRDYTARSEALMRERSRLKSSYMTDQEVQKINRKMAKAMNTINMMQAFVGGGAMGMGELGASPGYQDAKAGVSGGIGYP